jgi:hypothetical protein
MVFMSRKNNQIRQINIIIPVQVTFPVPSGRIGGAAYGRLRIMIPPNANRVKDIGSGTIVNLMFSIVGE